MALFRISSRRYLELQVCHRHPSFTSNYIVRKVIDTSEYRRMEETYNYIPIGIYTARANRSTSSGIRVCLCVCAARVVASSSFSKSVCVVRVYTPLFGCSKNPSTPLTPIITKFGKYNFHRRRHVLLYTDPRNVQSTTSRPYYRSCEKSLCSPGRAHAVDLFFSFHCIISEVENARI